MFMSSISVGSRMIWQDMDRGPASIDWRDADCGEGLPRSIHGMGVYADCQYHVRRRIVG